MFLQNMRNIYVHRGNWEIIHLWCCYQRIMIILYIFSFAYEKCGCLPIYFWELKIKSYIEK